MRWTNDTRPEDLKLGEYLLSRMRGKKENDTTWIWPAVVLAATIILAVLLVGCAQVSAETFITEVSFFTRASCLREGTSGIMANGERLDDDSFIAASWDFPFGTRLRVSRVDRPDLSCEVTVKDRGPNRKLYNKGRRLDISRKAAAALQILESGVAQVTVTLVEAL